MRLRGTVTTPGITSASPTQLLRGMRLQILFFREHGACRYCHFCQHVKLRSSAMLACSAKGATTTPLLASAPLHALRACYRSGDAGPDAECVCVCV